ncbi:MAG: hypothetical protein A2289_10715 [Deltaproteobacteria bacterium RIFOXYA12_FULL_58_15]|nr:MAG: hypothetical protein A2289_10715 [Deltaproteobacteria bacterium RIFOXYA12_FULL_58_15]OGR15077.1 MAG: hypothetical protein A2341_01570 [Deltaproteobacteria bacterium RIFOXYB12_FULL_58_9]
MVGLQAWREIRHEEALLRGLRGRLDEGFDPALLDPGDAKHIVFDLAHITHVASFGVRDWIQALNAIRGRVEGVYFVRCSPRITDQFNMVVGFDGGGTLLTFQAYYECDTCGEQSASLFDAQLDQEAFHSGEAPVRQCCLCGNDAELDDDPSVLFEYVRSTTYTPPPASVIGLLRKSESWIQEVPGVRLAARQSTESSVPRFELSGMITDAFSPLRFASSGQRVVLALGHVTHFDPSGFDTWRKDIRQLANDGGVSLVGCPPPVLRQFVNDPSLVAGAEVTSLRLAAQCGKCKQLVRSTIPLQSIESALKSPPKCPRCDTPLAVKDRAADWRAFAAAASQRDSLQVASTAPAIPQPTVERPEPVAVAESFADKYEVLCKLAEGGMAEVFLVRQHGPMGFRRLAVIKKIRPELLTDDRMVRLFLDEAKLAARLDHANIIRVYDLGRSDGSLYMVLEYVHGRSLAQIMSELVSKSRTVTPALAANIAADLARGLARAHAPDTVGRVLVHRDITPNNVLVSFDGTVKLVDFGLAGYRRSKWDRRTILGSPPWVAPEVYRGKEATPQTDIWGVGLLLQAMLTATVPFHRSSIEATAHAILDEKIKRPWFGSKVPRRLAKIIDRCLDKQPDKRFENAATLEDALRRAALKIGGPTDLSSFARELYSHELQFENEFFMGKGASSFVDALHTVDPEPIAQFFRLRAASIQQT